MDDNKLVRLAAEAGVNPSTMKEILVSEREQKTHRDAAHNLILDYMQACFPEATDHGEMPAQLKTMVDHIIMASMCGAHALVLRSGRE